MVPEVAAECVQDVHKTESNLQKIEGAEETLAGIHGLLDDGLDKALVAFLQV